jgi:hypothetical protein
LTVPIAAGYRRFTACILAGDDRSQRLDGLVCARCLKARKKPKRLNAEG